MKQHFCPAEQSMIAFEKECNWCGELEIQEPDVQETLHWHAFNYRQADTAQAHEMWLALERFVDGQTKAAQTPQRKWIELTDDEYAELAQEYGPFPINQIEAKLKEKNI